MITVLHKNLTETSVTASSFSCWFTSDLCSEIVLMVFSSLVLEKQM